MERPSDKKRISNRKERGQEKNGCSDEEIMKMKIAIFGSGHFGRQALKEYGAGKVSYFIDNNQEKWGKECQGKPIISLKEYKEMAEEYHTVIAVDAFSAIIKQLQENGITEYEIYNPFYKKRFDELKECIKGVSGTILLCGIDEKTELVWNLLLHCGIPKDKIILADTEEYQKKTPFFQKQHVNLLDGSVQQADTIIISAENRAYALQAFLEKKAKNKRILNAFILTEYGDKDRLVVNPYEGLDHDISEQEWVDHNDNAGIRLAVQSYMEELAKDLPLFQHIEIETYNRCNGVCSFCPVSVGNEKRPLKRMDEELFKRLIDQLSEMDYTGRLAIFSNNEPFLDERIVAFNQYAREKLPGARMHLFTNGTVLKLEDFVEIMNYLDELVIDNYNQELKLIPSVKRIVAYCEEHPELKERVTVVTRKPKEVRTSRGGDAPNREKTDYMASFGCVMPFKQMIVRPDGKVSLCCNDPYGKCTMGDLTTENIKDVWYGEEFTKAREAIRKGRGNYEACRYCDTTLLF